jgi:predicted  nucleic acid-binding Zn-ribbon protein
LEIGKLTVELGELKRQLAYKEEDLRAMNEKYHRLEQKLEMVMESQEKLKVMESRIVALGQDNNLVKNFAEIIKTRSK